MSEDLEELLDFFSLDQLSFWYKLSKFRIFKSFHILNLLHGEAQDSSHLQYLTIILEIFFTLVTLEL